MTPPATAAGAAAQQPTPGGAEEPGRELAGYRHRGFWYIRYLNAQRQNKSLLAQRGPGPVSTIPAGAGTSAIPLALRPLSANISFRDQAYAALKQAITEADIYSQPHELRLDERQLSRSLGVSRTPIREAMTLLEQEGFLRTVPRRGIFIVRKTKRQIVEMIEMWAALESMAARLATLNASDAEIATLRTMFDEFRNSTPAEHIDEYSDANIAFHQAIIRLSGSHLMGKTIENLFIHVRAMRRLTISRSDRAARSIVDHMRIIEALEGRDTELAERLVRDHSLDLAAFVEKNCDFLE
jgi:DNA-binding GntR family transcriptional regulator